MRSSDRVLGGCCCCGRGFGSTSTIVNLGGGTSCCRSPLTSITPDWTTATSGSKLFSRLFGIKPSPPPPGFCNGTSTRSLSQDEPLLSHDEPPLSHGEPLAPSHDEPLLSHRDGGSSLSHGNGDPPPRLMAPYDGDSRSHDDDVQLL